MEIQINLDKTNLNSEENKKIVEEYIKRMGLKDLLESVSTNPNINNENKMRIYQKILENEGKFENPEDIINYSDNQKDNLNINENDNLNLNLIEQQHLHGQGQGNAYINNSIQESLLLNTQKNTSNNNNLFIHSNIMHTNSSAMNNINNNNDNFNNNNNPLIQTSNFHNSSNNFMNNINNNNLGNFNFSSNSNINGTAIGNSFNNINANANANANLISDNLNYNLNLNRNGNLSANINGNLNLNSKGNINNRLNNSKNLSLSPNKIKTQADTVNTEREKIHMLNIKAMNYRHEVETLKKKITDLYKIIEDQKEKIYRIEKQKENDNKYLIKLENMLAAQSTGGQPSINALLNNLANNNINMSSMSNLSQKNFTAGIYVELKKCTNLIVKDKVNNLSLNLIDQNDMKEFILNLMNECQKLKAFQRQVFDISKNYDDINENIINSIKTIQNIMEISSVKSFDENQKKEIYGNFKGK
jgi:hypothetical protein